jgi:hypothetical protein
MAMFDSTSRYAGLPTAEFHLPEPDGEGRSVRYVRRRFVPHPDEGATLVEHLVTQGERLDHVTARHLGDPAQFWRVADANRALRPDALVEEPGVRVRVALPSGVAP